MLGTRFPEKGFGVRAAPGGAWRARAAHPAVPFSDGFRACAIQPLDPPLSRSLCVDRLGPRLQQVMTVRC
jgi:hypothetical protein